MNALKEYRALKAEIEGDLFLRKDGEALLKSPEWQAFKKKIGCQDEEFDQETRTGSAGKTAVGLIRREQKIGAESSNG